MSDVCTNRSRQVCDVVAGLFGNLKGDIRMREEFEFISLDGKRQRNGSRIQKGEISCPFVCAYIYIRPKIAFSILYMSDCRAT